MTAPFQNPLTGVRVLDASRVLAGPFAGQILADLGADVVTVEQPGSGDETRHWGPPFDGDLSAYFLSCNRGKRSVALDLKQAEGRQLFLKLAAKSDIVLENFRGDSLQSLKLTAKDLHAVNPKLVICSLSGYGRKGKFAEQPGYDFVVQGLSGMMAATGPKEGPPFKFGVAIADIVTGHYAAHAVLAALHARAGSGHGYAIELALIDCAVATMANVAQAYLTSGKQPSRQGNAHLQIVPYQDFRTKDGRLTLAVGNDGQFRRFAALVDRAAWAVDPRFATNEARVRHRGELEPLIAEIFLSKPTAEWLKLLEAAKLPAGPVWTLAEFFASDLAKERRLKMTVKAPDGRSVELLRSPLVDAPGSMRMPPELGQHTDQVLKEFLGLSPTELARLKAEGVT